MGFRASRILFIISMMLLFGNWNTYYQTTIICHDRGLVFLFFSFQFYLTAFNGRMIKWKWCVRKCTRPVLKVPSHNFFRITIKPQFMTTDNVLQFQHRKKNGYKLILLRKIMWICHKSKGFISEQLLAP